MSNPEPDPELPYAGTSGWSGSETSYARAIESDSNGSTGMAQRLAKIYADRPLGVTMPELSAALVEVLGERGPSGYHGTASGALSVLHKTGRLECLQEERGGCQVYVTPDQVRGRPRRFHRGRTPIRGDLVDVRIPGAVVASWPGFAAVELDLPGGPRHVVVKRAQVRIRPGPPIGPPSPTG